MIENIICTELHRPFPNELKPIKQSQVIFQWTNYIEQIDRALTRPGRFDCCIEFDNANDEMIIQMIKHFSKNNIKKLVN